MVGNTIVNTQKKKKNKSEKSKKCYQKLMDLLLCPQNQFLAMVMEVQFLAMVMEVQSRMILALTSKMKGSCVRTRNFLILVKYQRKQTPRQQLEMRDKLATPKPWFSPSISVDNSILAFDNRPVSDSAVSDERCPFPVLSIPHTNIYDIFDDTEAKQPQFESPSTTTLRESRFLRPRILVEKNSK